MTNEEFEPIRIRIMQVAYDLADRNDTEGFNAVKVMCSDVQNLTHKIPSPLTLEELRALDLERDCCMEDIRKIERHHGIGEKND